MKKGFTLIEILIASAIFVVVMIMSTTIFGMASSFVVKLHEMRNVTETNRSAADRISADIRAANGKSALKVYNSAGILKDNFEVGEIAILNCTSGEGSSCQLQDGSMIEMGRLNQATSISAVANYNRYEFPLSNSKFAGNALLLINQDQAKYILYWNLKVEDNYLLFRREIALPSKIDFTSADLNINGVGSWPTININNANNNGISLQAAFAGYMPKKSARKYQPFAEFLLRSESWNFESTLEQYRARFDLKSMVETRDYNPV